jgi:DNA uptake protein ComE-like DNA-binding protein
MKLKRSCVHALAAVAASLYLTAAEAQVAKGLVDPNVATEKELLALPHMTPTIAKATLEKRPFLTILEWDAFLAAQGLSEAQRAEVYAKAFVHINLDTASGPEILLIPGAGKRMAREFAEYRPWGNFARFDKEIGKYVDAAQVARLKQYTFIPIDLNSASDEDILSIPGLGPRMLREFKEYRPYKTIEQFRKEIGKYVDKKEVARLERYVTIR